MIWLFQAAKVGSVKNLAQAIRAFFKMNNRMPSTREKDTMGVILEKVTGKSNVIEFPKDKITNPFVPRPGDVKKTDESPLSTLLSKQSKELEGIDTTKGGMGFYSELGDMMKKHKLEELELAYDDMYNKILDKAKRIESDPLPLLEAELGKKLTGKETTTELLEIFKNRPKKASGGIARVGYAAGKIVKGGAWIIKNLKKSVKEVDQGKGSFSKLNSMQQGLLKKELNTLIKQLEQGGTIPNEMLDTMIADPKFKSVVKTRSTDKDLYELEDVLLDRQAGKQAEQIVDDVFGKGHTENQQIDMLEKFDVTGRKKNASGGIAGQLHLNRPGYESGLKVYPKIDITETGQTPAEGIDVGVRDITYGGTGLYQGDKWFAGAEGLTGDVKVDVTAEVKTLFKDTMSKDDALNYILGLGEAEGDKFQIKSDEDFDNVQIVFKKKFAEGGRVSLSKGGLAHVLGV